MSHQLQQARQDTNELDNIEHELEEVTIQGGRHNQGRLGNDELDESAENEGQHDDNSNTSNREILIDENALNSGSTRLDLQLFTRWIEQSFPFIILLVLLWIYQHRNGIVTIPCTHVVTFD